MHRIARIFPITCAAILAALAALGLAMSAQASELIADRNPTQINLKVNAKGEALVTYRRETGATRHLLAWGAVNALAPSPDTPQVKMSFDYAGGWSKYKSKPVPFRVNYWKSFKGCGSYDGPALVYFVAACKAPDGSYWALQSWQRLQPLLGFDPWLKKHTDWELHISHWTGPLPALELFKHWSYNYTWEALFARFTYVGQPVYGLNFTKRGVPLDGYGRNVYIDTYDSVYGKGWKRESGILAHRGTGTLCHSFVPQIVFSDYPTPGATRPSAPGTRYRATAMGPGVTPVIQTEVTGLGAFDALAAAAMDSVFESVMAGDAVCAPER
jgi:hypothetical protein